MKVRVAVIVACLLSTSLHSIAGQDTESLIAKMRAQLAGQSRPSALDHECFFHEAACNRSVADEISIFGCRSDDGLNYFTFHRLTIPSNRRFTVRVRPATFSPFIVLFDPSDNIIADSYAGKGGEAVITREITNGGTYVVGVVPMEDLATGAYTFTTVCETIEPPPPVNCSACVHTNTTTCLLGNRFRVEMTWRNQFAIPATSGTGTVIRYAENRAEIHPTLGPLSETAYFQMFQPQRVEVVVKMLSGTGINNMFWVFATGLTNNEYWITVTDTRTCRVWNRYNQHGQFSNLTDFEAFPLP